MQHNKNPQRIGKIEIFASLPSEWPQDLLPEIGKRIHNSGQKVVVLDDDPTGTQTVHGVPVLTGWSVDEVQAELTGDFQAFYILTNSRSFTLEDARSLNMEIGRNLASAAQRSNRRFVVVSRSDSTLRGHFPGEVEALAKGLAQNFDGWIVTPFFPEGGRYTIEDIHYVDEDGWLVPAAETEFAKDHMFGYHASNLCQWVAEKTAGRISSKNVMSLSIRGLRERGPEWVAASLTRLHSGSICVVNAVSYRDLEVLVLGLLEAEKRGKKFLYRTAASFVRVRAGLSARPLLNAAELDLTNSGGGLIIVGSYVPRTTNQVNKLLSDPEITRAEIRIAALLADEKSRLDEIDRVAAEANRALQSGKDIIIYTSRRLVTGEDEKSSLFIGKKISNAIIACLQKISTRPRFIIAKGGITASDVATEALNVKRAMVCGQIQPGVPVWKLGSESRYPELVYVVFPGNVGDATALVDIVENLCGLK